MHTNISTPTAPKVTAEKYRPGCAANCGPRWMTCARESGLLMDYAYHATEAAADAWIAEKTAAASIPMSTGAARIWQQTFERWANK